MEAPSAEVLVEARQIVKDMMASPRGPYSRIRWFCNDGTVLPPTPSACRDHGGGRQHGEFSEQRNRLATLGWSVGTLYAPLSYEQLRDPTTRDARLRQLALEKYLSDIDDGWVLKNAKNYRGRAQLEDEVASGGRILLRALEDSDWVADNYLLIRELVRVIPHGEETDLTRKVRRDAIDLAVQNSSAEALRAEIHSSPSAETANRLRVWASRLVDSPNHSAAKKLALSLADDLDQLYGEKGRTGRLNLHLANLKSTQIQRWRDSVAAAVRVSGEEKISTLCQNSFLFRSELLASLSNNEKLLVLDALSNLETEVRLALQDADQQIYGSRASLFEVAKDLLNCVYGSGMISSGELAAARAAIESVIPKGQAPSVDTNRYKSAVSQLRRLPAWAASNVRYTFAEALVSYGALDARAVRFTDDLLRGSPLWSLSDILNVLSKDVAAISDNQVSINGQNVASALALNPGMAKGTLRIFETLDEVESDALAPSDIVALPETIAELKPVAGILTLGEGNALSHVQLLARNFGIPNVAIDFSTIDLLKPLEGQEVALIVSSDGNVILKPVAQMNNISQLFPSRDKKDETSKIAVPPADLGITRLLPIAEINRSLSGKIIGPKAANLGELNRLFPGKVAPALAVPFGIYSQHLERAGIGQRIRAAYAAHNEGSLNPELLNDELAEIRAAIAALTLSDELKIQLDKAMASEFGESGTYGVFIRSDTNVEDLPQFTGAGLSETLPNLTSKEAILNGIPRVWASVLSPRAIAWRSSILTNPEQIYASVLIMKSVPSEKSGVLVTANLADPTQKGLTVSTAWGVGGAVSGEAAESLILWPGGKTSLISEAKTPYRRALNTSGGVSWLPAPAGAVLTPGDIAQLKELAAEVDKKYQPVFNENGQQRPWDIEFGFVDSKLTLFQIRPLVEKNTQRADTVIKQLKVIPTSRNLPDHIDLLQAPLSPNEARETNT